MNVVILAGGKGTRLKPVLKDGQNKPFVKAFKNGDKQESITHRNLCLLKNVCPSANIVVSTCKDYLDEAVSQLGTSISYCIEPSTRNTFAAVVLACSFLHKHNIYDNQVVIIAPSDSYVEESYFENFKLMEKKLNTSCINICLLGIKPYEISDQFGYMLKSKDNNVQFYEKPNLEKAKKLIEAGAYWNAGVFAFKLSYMLNKITEYYGSAEYDYILNNFQNIKESSFDYEILEKENKIDFVKYDGKWKDIGRPESFIIE